MGAQDPGKTSAPGADNSHHHVPMMFFRGTHYELGFQMGATYRDRVHYYYENCHDLKTYEDYYATAEGYEFCESFLEVARSRFPHFMEELRGISDGAGVPLIQAQLMNLDRELSVKLDVYKDIFEDVPQGCTDILVTNSTERLIGHNEDWVAKMKNQDMLLCAEITAFLAEDGRTFPAEKFMVHTWPGLLPGMNSGVNGHGVVTSIDHLFPKVIAPGKTADLFLCRHLLTAKNIKEGVQILEDEGYGAAVGFSASLGHTTDRTLVCVEVAPDFEHRRSKVVPTMLDPKDPECPQTMFHTNLYQNPLVSAIRPKHCLHREKRMTTMPPARDIETIRDILGDTEDPVHPLFCDDSVQQGDIKSATISTVIYDIGRQWMHLYRDNPKTCEPVTSLPFSVVTSTP